MKRLAFVAAAMLSLPTAAQAGSTVLSAGELRIDFAPTDFSILHSGIIGGARGFVIRGSDAMQSTSVVMGLGASYGFGGRAEAGVIVLPLGLSPDTGYGDITAHLRYRILTGTFEAAIQAAVRIPTETDFGLGLGVPVILHLSRVDIETGAELELEFHDNDTDTHLDIPVSILWNITGQVFAGIRTGAFLADFDRLDVALGPLAGARIRISNNVKLAAIAAFVFERFITSGGDGPFELSTWALHVGVALHFLL